MWIQTQFTFICIQMLKLAEFFYKIKPIKLSQAIIVNAFIITDIYNISSWGICQKPFWAHVLGCWATYSTQTIAKLLRCTVDVWASGTTGSFCTAEQTDLLPEWTRPRYMTRPVNEHPETEGTHPKVYQSHDSNNQYPGFQQKFLGGSKQKSGTPARSSHYLCPYSSRAQIRVTTDAPVPG